MSRRSASGALLCTDVCSCCCVGRGTLHAADWLCPLCVYRSVIVRMRSVVDALSEGGRIRVVTCVLRDGEQYKTLEELNKARARKRAHTHTTAQRTPRALNSHALAFSLLRQVFSAALEARLDRGTTFVALGGGVIGDTVGFAASAYQRGVAFVQIPTTLMAMVDSSVGGKTGVNHPLGKNMVGAFWQPRCVLVDTATLDTLPMRELASGLAEVVKYGLIRDAALFEWLESGQLERVLAREPAALAHCVAESCENKALVVAADEREAGLRATLNLGHTFGHAIETGTGYGTWLHGEAVAAGTVMAADMSYKLGWIDAALLKRTVDIMKRCQLPIAPPADGSMTRAKFESLMAVDKKAENGKMRLILLKGPLGGCVFTGDFDVAALKATIAEFCAA